jgi:hypothetical protein
MIPSRLIPEGLRNILSPFLFARIGRMNSQGVDAQLERVLLTKTSFTISLSRARVVSSI